MKRQRCVLRDYGFEEAIEDSDGQRMEQLMTDFKNDILDEWLNGSHEGFETFLRLSEQQCSRMLRSFGEMVEREMCVFYLGMLSCIIQVFQALFREESKDDRLLSDTVRNSSKTEEILLYLYQLYQEGTDGIRHGKLAESLGMTDSALSNAMKRVLRSGAVDVSRYGKSTFYSLTNTGRRYCAKQQPKYPLINKQLLLRGLQKMLEEIPDSKNFIVEGATDRTPPVVRQGDTITQQIAGGGFQRLYVDSVLEDITTHEKIVRCDPVLGNGRGSMRDAAYLRAEDSVYRGVEESMYQYAV